MAEKNGLGDKKIKGLPGVIPTLSNYAEFFPGMPKSWALTFMINDEDAPTGRPAGALGWAGLPNLFYWIDRRNGIGGFWATQVFPFADPDLGRRLHRLRDRGLRRPCASTRRLDRRSAGPACCAGPRLVQEALTGGTSRSRQILRASWSSISRWRGTAERRFRSGSCHHECRPPSRSITHPCFRKCRRSSSRFIRRS